LVGHYVDGLFDIFCIGASNIAPFMIAGISLGMSDAHQVVLGPGEGIGERTTDLARAP
jgi:hypothetical protein